MLLWFSFMYSLYVILFIIIYLISFIFMQLFLEVVFTFSSVLSFYRLVCFCYLLVIIFLSVSFCYFLVIFIVISAWFVKWVCQLVLLFFVLIVICCVCHGLPRVWFLLPLLYTNNYKFIYYRNQSLRNSLN